MKRMMQRLGRLARMFHEGNGFSGKSGKEGWTNIVHPLARLGGCTILFKIRSQIYQKTIQVQTVIF